MPNLDGTKQVSPPTRSAFAPPAASPKKAAPATSKDSSDKSQTPDHETNVIEGIKGLIRQHAGGSANKNEDSALHAMDAGVSSAPGNLADY